MNFASHSFLGLIALLFCFSSQHNLTAKAWDKRVYLATYPKSGNHWLRYLFEEATHIATSSVYTESLEYMWDYGRPHLPEPFPWGGYCTKNGYEGNCRYPNPDDIFVVKTHYPMFREWPYFTKLSYIKIIRIVRHPVDSFYSVLLEKPLVGRVSSKTLKEFIASWREFQEYWDTQPNVFTVKYEDLYNSPQTVFRQIIDAAGYNVQEADIERAIATCPPKGGTMKYLHLFHPEDLNIIAHELRDLMEKYGYAIPKELLFRRDKN